MPQLTADKLVDERFGKGFGYPVRAGAKFFRGSILGVTATGLLDAAATSGIVAIVGVSPRAVDNTGGADGATTVTPRRGVLQYQVGGSPTHAAIGAAVYQVTDDNTLTLTASTNLRAGTLVGIEGGLHFVEF